MNLRHETRLYLLLGFMQRQLKQAAATSRHNLSALKITTVRLLITATEGSKPFSTLCRACLIADNIRERRGLNRALSLSHSVHLRSTGLHHDSRSFGGLEMTELLLDTVMSTIGVMSTQFVGVRATAYQ